MFRFAHISDIHLGPLPAMSAAELASKRITGYINWQRNRRKHLVGNTLETVTQTLKSLSLDHVAITGDLVNLGTAAEIALARLWLATGFDPQATSLVLGNHDAYVPGAFVHAVNAWRPWITSDPTLEGDSDPFPTLTIRGPVAFIGISTANATLPFRATGTFSRAQARLTGAMLDKAEEIGLFRVVLIHHPPVHGAAPWNKRMIGIDRFQKMIAASGADLILHGHTHLNSVHHVQGATHSVPVIGVASASQGHGVKKPAATLNLFAVDGEAGSWSCTHQRYQLAADGTGMTAGPVNDLNEVV